MAEFTPSDAPDKKTLRKLSARVDLTAMVDLAFLLITFFMLTTSLTKPHAMDLSLPDNKGLPQPVDENRTMTILVGDGNKAKCFMGKMGDRPGTVVSLGTRELRRELAAGKQKAKAYGTASGKPDGLIVLIKPDAPSNYGNLVDILDEMAIADVPTYAIVDIGKSEQDFLRR